MDNKPYWWSMFEDNSGGISSVRILLTFIVLSVLLTWMMACYFSGTLLPLPESAVMLITTFGGIKAAQRFGEKSDDDPPGPTPTPITP